MSWLLILAVFLLILGLAIIAGALVGASERRSEADAEGERDRAS